METAVHHLIFEHFTSVLFKKCQSFFINYIQTYLLIMLFFMTFGHTMFVKQQKFFY